MFKKEKREIKKIIEEQLKGRNEGSVNLSPYVEEKGSVWTVKIVRMLGYSSCSPQPGVGNFWIIKKAEEDMTYDEKKQVIKRKVEDALKDRWRAPVDLRSFLYREGPDWVEKVLNELGYESVPISDEFKVQKKWYYY